MRHLSLFLSLIVLSACRPAAAPAPKREADVPMRPSVMVLAGDILVIDGQHIHLAGVVTPQPLPAARCWAEAVAAKQTRLQVKALVTSATNIKVTPTGEYDAQRRILGQVNLDGVDLGEQLLQEGAAAKPGNGSFRWCDPITRERDGAPTVLSLLTPMG